MNKDISRASFVGLEDNNKLPKGAKILSENPSITVEEISNGFIIRVDKDIKYQTKEGTIDYTYISKKAFSKNNPLNIDLENIEKEKSLATIFKGL